MNPAPTHATQTSPSRFLVLLNPAAGRRGRRYVESVIREMQALGARVDVYETQGQGDVIRVLPRLAADFEVIVAAGGDGTVNEVLNGLRGRDALLGIIPSGTTNVLATELGLPRQPARLAALLVAAPERAIYPADLNGRRFGMMVGIGYDAWVVEGVDTAFKKKLGKLAYVISMLRQLKAFGTRQYRLEIDGSIHTAASAVLTLGRHYAGSYVLSREARIDHPAIDAVLVQTLNRWAFLLMLFALPLGLASRLPFMRIVRGQRIRVERLDGGTESVQADGDTLSVLPAEIRVEGSPQRVIAPPG